MFRRLRQIAASNVNRQERSRSRLLAYLLLTVFCIPLLTGCWDRLEIEERALVLGVGVDIASPEDEKKEANASHLPNSFPKPNAVLLKVTVQIAVPGRIPLGPGEGGGSGKGQKPVWVLSSVGYTLDDALNNLQQELADRMFFGHLRVIVLSQKFAKLGMSDINDYLRRAPDVRRTTWMVVCEDQAEDLMKMAPQLERVPSLYLLATMDQAVRMGKLPNAFVGTYWTADSALGMDPFLPYVKLIQSGNMRIAGLAMFSGAKMVGHSEPVEIGAYMAVKGLNPSGYSVQLEVPGSNTLYMYQITHRSSRISVTIKDGRPEFLVKINSEGNIKEKSNDDEILDVKMINQIEQQLVKNGQKAIIDLIKKTQVMGSDIFGFGEYVRAKYPGFWNKTVDSAHGSWDEMYKDAVFKVDMIYKIRRVGGKST